MFQLINKLKEEAAESASMAKEMEDRYHKTAEELDTTRAKLESAWLKNSQLEMELKSKGNYRPALSKQPSTKKISTSKSQNSVTTNNEQEDSDTVTETESEGNLVLNIGLYRIKLFSTVMYDNDYSFTL